MKAIFKDESFLPYHDFDSGDCYIMLAQAYLAAGDTDKAMDSVENSIMYYLDLCKTLKINRIEPKALIQTPFVKETEGATYFDRPNLKQRLLDKLSASEIEPLKNSKRFKALYEKVISTEYEPKL
jgi:hypothetical protein